MAPALGYGAFAGVFPFNPVGISLFIEFGYFAAVSASSAMSSTDKVPTAIPALGTLLIAIVYSYGVLAASRSVRV